MPEPSIATIVSAARMRAPRAVLLAMATLVAMPALPVSAAPSAKHYPAELAGVWLIRPETGDAQAPCKKNDPMVQDSEAALFISDATARQYESSATPRNLRKIAKRPAIWEIDEVQEEAGETWRSTRLYVLQPDRLTVFEDDTSLVYIRCL